MSYYIGDVEIPVINNIDTDDGVSVEELNLVDKDYNIALYGEREGIDMSIEFSLVERLSEQEKSIEEQRRDIKRLSNNHFKYNTMDMYGYKGWISVEEVSIPEESSVPTYREGEISGKFIEPSPPLPDFGEQSYPLPDFEKSYTFDDTGEHGIILDVSLFDKIEAEMWGAAGATSVLNESYGGYIKVEIDTTDMYKIILYSGESGSFPDGGRGLYNGGDAGYDESHEGYGGGGSTSITDGDGKELVHADGSGGERRGIVSTVGGDGGSYGGGGGARGGEGGEGDVNGEDGEGDGFGGDGGGDNNSSGEDGGQEIIDSNRVILIDEQVGGGNDGDGEIVLYR